MNAPTASEILASMKTLEIAALYARTHEARDRLHAEWKRLSMKLDAMPVAEVLAAA